MAESIIDMSKIEIDGVDLTGDLSALSTERLFELRNMAIQESLKHASLQVTFKTLRNSVYGATSNRFYHFFNMGVAESITAEGRNFIHSGEAVANDYLNNKWWCDYELHKKLRNDPKLKGNFEPNVTPKLEPWEDKVLYIDTDSLYINFEPTVQSIGYIGKNYYDLILKIFEYRMEELFNKSFADAAAKRHANSVLLFDLETISDTAIFAAKKKYLKAQIYVDGRIFNDPTEHIQGKGIELIQTGSSMLVRQMLDYAFKKLFKGELNNETYRKLMRTLWKRFESEQDIEKLCSYVNANKYYDYVIDSTNELKFKKGVLPQYRGAAYFNYLVHHWHLETRYSPIEGGRLFFYFIDKNKADLSNIPLESRQFCDAFAFKPGELPSTKYMPDMPPMNKHIMFDKLVVQPISRLVALTGINVSDPLNTLCVPSLNIGANSQS